MKKRLSLMISLYAIFLFSMEDQSFNDITNTQENKDFAPEIGVSYPNYLCSPYHDNIRRLISLIERNDYKGVVLCNEALLSLPYKDIKSLQNLVEQKKNTLTYVRDIGFGSDVYNHIYTFLNTSIQLLLDSKKFYSEAGQNSSQRSMICRDVNTTHTLNNFAAIQANLNQYTDNKRLFAFMHKLEIMTVNIQPGEKERYANCFIREECKKINCIENTLQKYADIKIGRC